MSMSNSQEVLTSSSGTKKRSRVRIVILLLLSVGTMINYLDRTILGIVAPQLTQEIHIDPAMMGIIFSAFAWTYALAQIPGGVFLDRFGNKLTYALSIFFWSLFTLLQSFTLGLKTLLLLRLGLGVSEAPCFPANSRIVSTWFPQHERARATATYTVGEYIGLAAFSPLLFLILEHHGWRTLFFLTGGLGILFTLVWWRFYHEPHQSRIANKAELDYIGVNSINNKIQNVPFNWRDARRLLGCRQIVGASLGQFAGNTTLVFFLTWFPSYLANERHLPWLHVGFFAPWPFLAAAIGILFGGWISDRLLKRTGSVNISRKLPIISGLLLSSCIIAANWGFVE